jgi:hypothetical protein
MNRITTCPHCSKRLRVSEQITDKTLLCPHCLAEVDNPQSGFQVPYADLDTDVKRDLSVASIVLVVLIGLCIVGIITAIYLFRNPSTALNVLLVSCAALAVLIIVAIVRGLIRWGRSGARAPVVAALIGIPFLVLGSIAAVILFFIVTCMNILDPKHLGH